MIRTIVLNRESRTFKKVEDPDEISSSPEADAGQALIEPDADETDDPAAEDSAD